MASGAKAALQGYEYQIEASVWLALVLLLETGRTGRVDIEPASGDEDMEAYISLATAPADCVQSTLTIEGTDKYRALFQMKTRSVGPWGAYDFAGVIGDGRTRVRAPRGPAPRKLAAEVLLTDPTCHYFFVTDAGVEKSLNDVTASTFAFNLEGGQLPAGIIEASLGRAQRALDGRIHILASTTRELIRFRSLDLLNNVGKVPQVCLDACMAELIGLFRSRVAGTDESPFSLHELRSVLQRHEGLAEGSRNLYLPPRNIDDIAGRLERDNAVLLVGPQGVGKTALAEYLARHYRSTVPPHRQVWVNGHFERLKSALAEPGPAIIVVPDPWGTVKPEPGNLLTHELPNLLRGANSDKKIIITSRSNVYDAATGELHKTAFEPFRQPLAPNDYSAETLWRIVSTQADLDGLAETILAPYREYILSEVAVPQGLKIFGSKLRDVLHCLVHDHDFHFAWEMYDADGNPRLVKDLVKKANDELLGARTIDALQGWTRSPVEHATLFWLMLASGGMESIYRMQELVCAVRSRAPVDLQVTTFLTFMVKANLADVNEDMVSVHPSGVAALAKFSLRNHDLAAQFVTNLALGVLDRTDDVLNNVAYAVGFVEIFKEDCTSSVGWYELVERVDRAIVDACESMDIDTFATGISLAKSWRGTETAFVGFVQSLECGELPAHMTIMHPNQLLKGSYSLSKSDMENFLKRYFIEHVPHTWPLSSRQQAWIVRLITELNLSIDVELFSTLDRLHQDIYRTGYSSLVDDKFSAVLAVQHATSKSRYSPPTRPVVSEPYNPMRRTWY